ncbi:MAG TPA: phosphodiesterase, partial [Ktedonobacter sp.]|nr:phosphodiesterase [Ktedonobacter sp.]
YGPFSTQFETVVHNFFSALDGLFYQSIHGKLENTLLLLTADHGQVEVDPKTTYYLNKQIPDIERHLRTNKQGKPITHAGSPRDMFLYIKDEDVNSFIAEMRERLAGHAEVYSTQELLDQ